jgi:hypothetical protein
MVRRWWQLLKRVHEVPVRCVLLEHHRAS